MTSFFSNVPYGLERTRVRRDADQLIRLWGATAYDHATDLSWREDMGFIRAGQPGHWWNVRREIERRTGRKNGDPTVGVAA